MAAGVNKSTIQRYEADGVDPKRTMIINGLAEALLTTPEWLTGDSHRDIYSIYLKERIVKDQPSHWFLVVDMINDDKQTIQDLGNFCTPVSYGKGFEFMFGSMELAKKIMADTIPTYVKITK